MAILNANDVVRFATRKEEMGEKFYNELAKRTKDEKMKELFQELAREEIVHREFFEKMLKNLKQYLNLPEEIPQEEQEYLNYYTEKIIFDMQKLDQILSQINNIISALDFAIQRELDSILYYSELKRFAQESQQKLIDDIIDQERIHFLKLSRTKEKLQS